MPADAELSLAAKRVQQLESEAQHLLAQMNPGSYTTNPKTMPIEQIAADRSRQARRPARRAASRSRGWRPRSPASGRPTRSCPSASSSAPAPRASCTRSTSTSGARRSSAWAPPISRTRRASARSSAACWSPWPSRPTARVEKVEIDRSSGTPRPRRGGGAHRQLACAVQAVPRQRAARDRHPAHHPHLGLHPQRPAAAMTDRYAVIGNPVAHSKSPLIHAEFARQTGQDIEYGRLLAPLDGFRATVEAFRARGGSGLNVTLPFKLEAFELAQQRSHARAGCGGGQHAQVRRRRHLRRQHRRRRPGARPRGQSRLCRSPASACC